MTRRCWLTEDEVEKLNMALDLIGAVQGPMAIENEEDMGWRELYALRIKLGHYVHRKYVR